MFRYVALRENSYSIHIAVYRQPSTPEVLPELLMADLLCLLSGINANGGPTRLIDHEDLDTVSTTMASEILSFGQVSLNLETLTSIVASALQLTLPPREDRCL